MKVMTERERLVLAMIPIGSDKPISAAVISERMRIGIREVKATIRLLIHQYGIVILGSRTGQKGYYIPSDDAEREAGLKQLEAQVEDELERLRVLRSGSLTKHLVYLEDVG